MLRWYLQEYIVSEGEKRRGMMNKRENSPYFVEEMMGKVIIDQ